GPWITPEMSMHKVVHTERQVRGPAIFGEVLPEPEKVKGYYRDIAVLAFPTTPSKVPDIGAKSGMGSQVAPDGGEAAKVSADAIIQPEKMFDLTDKTDSTGRLTWMVPKGDWTIVRLGATSTGSTNGPAMEATRGLECDKMNPD